MKHTNLNKNEAWWNQMKKLIQYLPHVLLFYIQTLSVQLKELRTTLGTRWAQGPCSHLFCLLYKWAQMMSSGLSVNDSSSAFESFTLLWTFFFLFFFFNNEKVSNMDSTVASQLEDSWSKSQMGPFLHLHSLPVFVWVFLVSSYCPWSHVRLTGVSNRLDLSGLFSLQKKKRRKQV